LYQPADAMTHNVIGNEIIKNQCLHFIFKYPTLLLQNNKINQLI